MSKATLVCVSFAIVVAACATGGSDSGNGGGTDAAVTRQDAASVTADARRADAAVSTPDAQVSQLPDAGTGSGSGGLFCSQSSQCTVAGECCVTLGGPQGFCAPGTVILGQCVPQ